MNQNQVCQKCKLTWPGQRLFKCDKCAAEICLMCQCERAGWQSHVQDCIAYTKKAIDVTNAASTNPTAMPLPPTVTLHPVSVPFTRLQQGIWLHDRPEQDVYKLLVDSYRLRASDEFYIEGQTCTGSLYGGSMDGSVAFEQYLIQAVSRPTLLPSWWSFAHHRNCIAFGVMPLQLHDLRQHLTHTMVVRHYGDVQLQVQLRIFADAVTGMGIQFKDFAEVLGKLVDLEIRGGGDLAGYDWNALTSEFMKTGWPGRVIPPEN